MSLDWKKNKNIFVSPFLTVQKMENSNTGLCGVRENDTEQNKTTTK